jgi:phycocyanin-associated rod linker protein
MLIGDRSSHVNVLGDLLAAKRLDKTHIYQELIMISSTTARQLGIEPFISTAPMEMRTNASEGDIQAVIRATYRQVLGNEHLMQAERLTSLESLLRQGRLTVREFVRSIALSELYRNKFFQGNYQVRFIELNFKHLLGRAPKDQAEIAVHVNRYIEHGYAAEIDSYIESEEYDDNFGEMTVPYHKGFGTPLGQSTSGFNRMFQLYRGYAGSDRAQGNSKGHLTEEIAMNLAVPLRPSTLGGDLVGNHGGDRNQLYRIRVTQGASNSTTQIRRGISEYLVPYEQLSPTMQRLNQRGSRIVKITPA